MDPMVSGVVPSLLDSKSRGNMISYRTPVGYSEEVWSQAPNPESPLTAA
jgi:hypothetical protein